MRKIIAVISIILSSIFGISFSLFGLDANMPWKVKVIKPKDDNLVIKTSEDSDEIIFEKEEKQNNLQNTNNEPEEIQESKIDDNIFLVMATDIVYSARGRKTKSLNGRTDSIFIVKLLDDAINIVSIPRDTRVKIPGFYNDKINTANVYGGPELTLKTVNELFNLNIKKYVLINTFAVEEIVDLLGGIDYYIPKRMYYVDRTAGLYINMYPGYQHLSGKKVHDYLRFRHDSLGDLNRIKRQQDIIRAILPKVLTPKNILNIPSILRIVNKNIQTNIQLSEIMYLAKKLSEIENIEKKVNSFTLEGKGTIYKGGWYYILDDNKNNEILYSAGIKNSQDNNDLVTTK
ncbi:MAG: hypothetical protein KatS3mg068_2367 [Candidatus Sericytochromatia bacterium]|nr:MAG: hypothetical protein KatS3mg068_2367 [Candidatus Sericytochromatia bacterium]